MTFPRLLLLFAASQILFVGAVLYRAAPTAPTRAPADSWRRTVHGWEKLNLVSGGSQAHQPLLHPMVVASGQFLLCAIGLIALGQPRRRRLAPSSQRLPGPHYPIPWASRTQ